MAAKQGKNYAVVDLTGDSTGNYNITSQGEYAPAGNIICTVNGTEIPVSHVSLRYGLNAIPEATVIVALGRDTRNARLSTVYGQVAQLKQMASISIAIRGGLGDWATAGNIQWPVRDEAVIVFTGYVSGLSYRRTSGRVSCVINAVNRLIDLAMSAGGSKDIVPGSSADLLLPTLTPDAAANNIPYAGTADTRYANSLETDSRDDFSNAVLRCLVNISEKNLLQTHNKLTWCSGVAPPVTTEKNTQAARVIRGIGDWHGIANYSVATDAQNPTAKYVRKYPLTIPSLAITKAARSISGQLANSVASTSMWGMLIGSVAAEFGCAIIPMAQAAIFAPLLPMARQHQITIAPEEYVDFNFSCMSQRPLYGFGVINNYLLYTGAGKSDAPGAPCVGATYVANVNNSPTVDGMWMFAQAPDWLDDWTNSDPKATTNPAIVTMLNTPTNTSVGGAPNPTVNRDLAQETLAQGQALNSYARMMYAVNALRSREGVLVGKLRFDIAPGVTIKVKAAGQFAPEGYSGIDSLAESLLGLVSRVTITIDAEQGVASTSLELTNLRTESENKEDRFSMTTHPFFNTAYFTYAPIVPDLSLPPTRD